MKENKVLYGFLKIIYSSLLKILYRPEVYGIENIPEDGPIIFAGNHKHAFDPVVVMAHTKRIVHYMAKDSLFKGFHGFLFRQIGLIKIERGKSNPAALVEASNILQEGGTIGIFPEGTRNKTEEELLKFKHGAVVLSKKNNVPIIPFAIRGEYKIFKNRLNIEFGKQIDVSKMEIEEANDYIRNEVLNLLRK